MSSETSAMMLIVAAKLAAEERQSVKLHVGREITYEKVREVIKIMSTETNKNEEKFDTLYNEPSCMYSLTKASNPLIIPYCYAYRHVL